MTGKRIFVEIITCRLEPLLVGQVGEVIGQDWIPWYGEGDPVGRLLDVYFERTGIKRSFFMGEVRLAQHS